MKTSPSLKARYRPRVLLLIAAVVAGPLLTACEDAEQEAFLNFAVQWATAQGLISLKCEGGGQQNCSYELNEGELAAFIFGGQVLQGVAKAARLPPNKELGIALDAAGVILNQEKADDLVEKGAQEGDLNLIEQAIESRPDDWSYIDNKAAVQLANGDVEGANASFEKSEKIIKSRMAGGERCDVLHRNMLNHRISALETQIQRTQGQPNAELHDRLAEAHDQLAALNSVGPGSPC